MPHDQRSQGRKKSQFPANQVVLSGAFLDYFVDGTNYKIAFSDFLAALGVTGTIVQDGDPTAVPILDPQGSINAIRNFEAGAGINAFVSAQNGLAVTHDFIQGDGGTPVLVDLAAAQPKIKNLVGSENINVDGSDPDNIIITLTGALPQSNVVIINTVADFPAPVGDVITLVAGSTYILGDLIDIGENRLVMADGVEMFTNSRLNRGLTSITTGAIISTLLGELVVLRDMILSVPNGSYFDTDGGGTLVVKNVIGVACGLVSTMGAMASITFGPMSTFNGPGFLFSGAHGRWNMYRGFFGTWTDTLFDLGDATFSQGITFGSGVQMEGVAGNTFISGLPNNGNIGVGATSLILGNKFIGVGTRLGGGVSVDDERWQYIGNDTIQDTHTVAVLSMQGNAVATVNSVGVPVLVAGVWTVDNISQLSGDADGRVTYNGEKPVALTVTATLSMVQTGGNGRTIASYIALNGAIIPGSQQHSFSDNGDEFPITTMWDLTFNNGDFVEVWIENEDNADNITVQSAVLRVA